MDVYNVPEQGNADAYLIQGTSDPNSQLTTPVEPFEAMYNEGAQEFVVDQGMYYPSATSYGYICTGLESPGDWDDHHRVFGVDGQNFQFIGQQTESLPYVYYSPSYGYTQSPYNPYNPYIPGAMIGADGSFIGTQQYYMPSYENGSTTPVYYPMVVPSGPTEQFMDMDASTANRVDASGFNYNPSPAAATFSMNSVRGASNHTNTFGKVSEGFKSNGGTNKLPTTNGGVTSNSVSGPLLSQNLQGQSVQAIDNLSNVSNQTNQLKVAAFSSGNGLSNFGSSGNGRVVADKGRSKLPYIGKTTNDLNGNSNGLTEQNRGPRTNTSTTQLTVKAYSTRAGNSDANGNIAIRMDDYNKDDFPGEYVNAKFFVIKSYSEDDVHKSIKYNVWSSTPNGNKKLNSAYEEAQKVDSKGCPVFLFFSVNASGQFCGVAEMTGHVDFHKDMDFWQQDKWSGSFPVKWHIIKDVPNPHFRHIILENNEHKPVTNSRDTQEIKYKKGIEMLKVFKKYASKTSLLDDFMFYENRQKILQEEKARLLIKSYGVPVLHPPRKVNNFFDEATARSGDEKSDVIETDTNKETASKKADKENVEHNDNRKQEEEVVDGKPTEDDVLRIGSLAISSEPLESVVTVGSMEVKVSSGFLTVGMIPLDLKVNEGKIGKGG